MRENVTLGASFLKVLAERNGTRCNSPNEPNGPNESRSATIRRAMPLGSTPIASISDIVARSRSIIEVESRLIRLVLDLAAPVRTVVRFVAADLSGRDCRELRDSDTKVSADGLDLSGLRARQTRTPAPSIATMPKKRRALRSAGVAMKATSGKRARRGGAGSGALDRIDAGTEEGRRRDGLRTGRRRQSGPAVPHPVAGTVERGVVGGRHVGLPLRVRGRCYRAVTSAAATSPTMPRDLAEILSIVSASVW